MHKKIIPKITKNLNEVVRAFRLKHNIQIKDTIATSILTPDNTPKKALKASEKKCSLNINIIAKNTDLNIYK